MIFQRISPKTLSESEAASSYQESSQEQRVKHKQEDSNDSKQLTGQLTSDRDSSNAVKSGETETPEDL